MPKNFDKSKKHAAVIIGAPYGGVKEQGSGIYAQNMAGRGFVALAFDPSFNGYSGEFEGNPPALTDRGAPIGFDENTDPIGASLGSSTLRLVGIIQTQLLNFQ